MEHEQHSLEQPKRREWRPASVWKVIGITVAVLAVVVGLGFVGYIALVALAFSSYGSNK
ncbi:hypothetical protein SAMN05216199_2069 [Pedococcus cremeus]|uniref:Uncharacterized protein n=1 Tax=Pedococcus cremeus TaxID=587636 RepID=A0A1H9URK5_9MICO|nr:hypothetical protein [Pedococcus cremeus]SES11971.1 hypothetical protein SAMN05216199_2069 [Pedococcus cremeus]